MAETSLDRATLKKYLFPALAVGAILLLVGMVLYISNYSGRRMSDGSDGSADDPKLQEISKGVKYRDIKVGTGEECVPGSEVKVHIVGWLADGVLFENSRDTKSAMLPRDINLKNEIKGLAEGIPGMKPGGVRKLVIAPEKGYGPVGKSDVPPNSTLIYEVELISCIPPPDMENGPGQPMPFDGSNGGTDDPDLRDIGGGLKIRDLKEGSGEPVKEGAKVTMHYVGWTVAGDVFDSSRKRGEPAQFDLNDLIRGWQKGIPGMKPGGVRKLVVPADLGYGERGSPPKIPGGATLIFEVEVIR